LPRTDGHEEEEAPHDDLLLGEEEGEAVEVGDVEAADDGVDLDGELRFVGPLNGLDGALPRTGDAADGVVNGGDGAVEAHSEAREA